MEAKLAVEADGSGHGFPEQRAYDARRDAFLAAQGILVKRIWNHQLIRFEGRENLVQNLWQVLQDRIPHPENAPLPRYRRQPDNPSFKKPSP
jgi:very-short-patch-repair endonuclease